VLVVFTIAVGAVAVLLPRIPQPQSYHDFADQRSLLGIPNFGDVASNLLFAVSGVWGLSFCLGSAARRSLSIHASDGRTSLFSLACYLLRLDRLTTILLRAMRDWFGTACP